MVTEEDFIDDLKELLMTDSEISMDTDLLDIDEWDSFSAISFLAMISEKYGVNAEPFSVAEAVFVEDLYLVVNKGKT